MVMLPQGVMPSMSSALSGFYGALSSSVASTMPDDIWGQKANMLSSLLPTLAPGSPTSIALQSNIAALQTQSKRHQLNVILDKQYPGNGILISGFKESLKAISNLEPDSQQAGLYKMLARLFGQMQGIPKKEIDKQLITSERLALASITGALFMISANLEPESPTALNIQMRIADIQKMDKALDAKIKTMSAL